jgi:molecular chaperone GrpE
MTLQDRLQEIQENLAKSLGQRKDQKDMKAQKDQTQEMNKETDSLKKEAVAAETETVATEAVPAPENPVEVEALTAPSETDQLKAEQDALIVERDLLIDRLARLQAEFENARKREQRERADFRDYATANVVEKFLPVLDNFSLALKAEGSAEQMRQGVELIIKQMEEVLRQLDVLPVEAVGAAFDPRVHEALGSEEREDVPDHQVIDEIRRGYRIRERLLRPAMVRVATNKKQTEA